MNMILFKNSYITLEYDPQTDILSVDMPTVDHLILPEVKLTLNILVEHVRNYNVKKLLVDARKTVVEVDETTYTHLVEGFSRELMATNIEKVARIVTKSTIREGVVKKVYGKEDLPIKFRSFEEREEALEWLKA